MSLSRKMETIRCYVEPIAVVSSSRFAAKEMVVYKVPTLDECIGMLPKAVGNYILSFTSFWIEFYLQNIKEKYGNKFVIEMMDRYLCCNKRFTTGCRCSRMEFRGRSKMNQEELVNALIFSIIGNYREKKYIPIAFECLLEEKKENKLKKEEILKTIAVGDMLRNNTAEKYYGEMYYLVVYVDENYYKVLTVRFWKNNDEYYVWLISNRTRKENRKKNKLIFTERMPKKIIKSRKTTMEIDFTLSDVEIYHQI